MILPLPSEELILFSSLNTLKERRKILTELRLPYNLESDNDKALLAAIEKIDEQILFTLNRINTITP